MPVPVSLNVPALTMMPLRLGALGSGFLHFGRPR
jgi:hypothetical protein